jgi:nucleotide-binding universal stress UspA family protein
MYERIVVALDGSELAEEVLPHVVGLAGAFRPTVTLVQAYDPPTTVMAGIAAGYTAGPGPLLDPMPAVEAGRREVDAYLAGVAERLSAAGILTEAVRLARPAAEGILEVARERHATLIAMTTHGRGGLVRLVFGSVAEAVLRAAPCPVLLVRVGVAGEGAREDAPDAARESELVRLGASQRPRADELRGPGRRGSAPRYRTPANELTWVSASPGRPYPVCGATGGCAVVDDAGYVCCRTVCSDHCIEDRGWLHQLHQSTTPARTRQRTPRLVPSPLGARGG